MRSLPRFLAIALLFLLPAPGLAETSSAGDRVGAEVERRLAELAERTGTELRGLVSEGQVVVQGRVHLLEHSLRAEQLVWQTPGVVDVDNEIRVVPRDVTGDEAIEREVRLVIKGEPRFQNTNLEVGVLQGVVSLRGLFQDPVDVLALKHRVASISGVVHVVIDAHVVAGTGRGDRDGIV